MRRVPVAEHHPPGWRAANCARAVPGAARVRCWSRLYSPWRCRLAPPPASVARLAGLAGRQRRARLQRCRHARGDACGRVRRAVRACGDHGGALDDRAGAGAGAVHARPGRSAAHRTGQPHPRGRPRRVRVVHPLQPERRIVRAPAVRAGVRRADPAVGRQAAALRGGRPCRWRRAGQRRAHQRRHVLPARRERRRAASARAAHRGPDRDSGSSRASRCRSCTTASAASTCRITTISTRRIRAVPNTCSGAVSASPRW